MVEIREATLDDAARRKIELWFFRDMSSDQRLKLFGLFGMPVDEIGQTHGHQRIALRRILATLSDAVAEREAEPVVQFRKVGCSDWYDGYADHEDGRGPYEQRTLYLSPPTSELEALRKRVAELEKALPFVVQYRLRDTGVRWNDMAAFDTEGPAERYCQACAEATSFWEYRTARRVREGGKVE